MPKVNVFQDKDGDLVVTNADKTGPGMSCFQIRGASSNKDDVVPTLQGMSFITLLSNVGVAGENTGAIIASLEHKLVNTVEVDESDAVWQVLIA